ncbi:unnamed protein product [Penicillium glandicola]
MVEAVLDFAEAVDWGGVYINSGIPNRASFLAATKIGGCAWEGAKFKDIADLTIEIAGEHMDKIREAWTLVGHPFPK